jgi:hypothetical protein
MGEGHASWCRADRTDGKPVAAVANTPATTDNKPGSGEGGETLGSRPLTH